MRTGSGEVRPTNATTHTGHIDLPSKRIFINHVSGHDRRGEPAFGSLLRSDTTAPLRNNYSVSSVLYGFYVLK